MVLGMALLTSGPAGVFAPASLKAATSPGDPSAGLADLSVPELRRRLAILEAEASVALADEDYDLQARLRRDMAPLEAEILRREREGAPTRPPDIRIRRP